MTDDHRVTKYESEILNTVCTLMHDSESDFKGHFEIELVKAAKNEKELEDAFDEYFEKNLDISPRDFAHLCRNIFYVGLEVGHDITLKGMNDAFREADLGEPEGDGNTSEKTSNLIL